MTRFYEAPPWRWVVTTLTGATVTFLDPYALNRQITFTLNDSANATCDLPADNPEINIAAAGVPFVSFNNKLLYCFRRDGGTPPWKCYFGGVIAQLNDEITSSVDSPITHLSAWDPWRYLDVRPVLEDDGSQPKQKGVTFSADGVLTAADVVVAVLRRAIFAAGGGPPSAQQCFIDYLSGTFTSSPLAPGVVINFQQGSSVGDAFRQMAQGGYCDIVLDPVYDPAFRPGILAQLNVYDFAGSVRNGAIFSWDMAGRSLVGMNRLQDGAVMANVVQYYGGVAGAAVTPQVDSVFRSIYGPYWFQQSIPGMGDASYAKDLEHLAFAQLALHKRGVSTLTVDPAPEWSPIPLRDYHLGDLVPVWATNRFRSPIRPTLDGGAWDGLYRVYEIPITLPDDAPETVTNLLLTAPNLDSIG